MCHSPILTAVPNKNPRRVAARGPVSCGATDLQRVFITSVHQLLCYVCTYRLLMVRSCLLQPSVQSQVASGFMAQPGVACNPDALHGTQHSAKNLCAFQASTYCFSQKAAQCE